ncbi:MAG: hypothetical protein Ct9H300mP7_4200 [Verrucomicrobiota bacterium]|nr:MAG: hypothetical protein Ct9H300mP7_4200 [Verrucomicrobiota bacterium]
MHGSGGETMQHRHASSTKSTETSSRKGNPAKLRSLRLTLALRGFFLPRPLLRGRLRRWGMPWRSLDDVGARALASDEIAITEINFNTTSPSASLPCDTARIA